MTTNSKQELFVWIWLNEQEEPVVAGRLRFSKRGHEFVYGQSYLEAISSISLEPDTMPLKPDIFGPTTSLFGVLRDAAPDAWGRRVLLYQLNMAHEDTAILSELDYLQHSSDDRIGALHFQSTSDKYIPATHTQATLENLFQAADAVETGKKINSELLVALQHGTSIGGARPKATLNVDNEAWIAKFSTHTDVYPVVRQEMLGMELARHANLSVADINLTHVMHREVLLVRRFDRTQKTRRHMFSALTALQLNEMEARYASYPDLAAFLWKYAQYPKTQCKELYRRMLFNILIGNTDDHARNHAFFWDGIYAELTPAYDVGVLSRIGQEASQAMIVGSQGTYASRANALSQCDKFGLNHTEANQLFDEMIDCIHTHWESACDVAKLTTIEREMLLGKTVLSPAVLF